jgi:guanosine-3',5'-bis(diphosphate) 3'-pyrophosphohydrolase
MVASIDEITQQVSGYWPGVDRDLLVRAYNFADHAHAGQRRKGGDPFITHPLNVSSILAHIEADPPSVASALLHDVVEDADVTLDDVTDQFGPGIARLVDGVTKLSNLNFRTEKEEQARNLRKMFLAMAEDIRVIIIKLADRLHNMRTLSPLAPDRREAIAQETQMIFAPLAHRLGIWRLKWELEDLSLRYLEPSAYFEIVEKLGKTRAEREREIDRSRNTLAEHLHEAGIEAEVYGRPKHIFSIYNKMRTQHIDFEQIGDLMALRVIVNSVGDCYAALGIVHDLWIPLEGQFTDYIARPKSNQYQSIHTKVLGYSGQPMEVQIRTREMHRTAEYGVAAHWRYKEGQSDPELDKHVGWLRQLLDLETDLQESHEFLELLQVDLFKDQVFVATPQGDVIDLPAGATPIDFAYRIHTEVGHRCVGAKVNGRLVPLDYRFRNGDVAEIMTQAGAEPSRDWLRIAQSSHARAKIRRFLRQKTRDDSIILGKEIFTREVERLKASERGALDLQRLATVAEHLNYNDLDGLYAAMGYGDVEPETVLRHLKRPTLPLTLADEVARFAPPRSPAAGQAPTVTSSGVKGFSHRMSQCCNPLPGDDIVGYITRGGGLAIHRSDCKNLKYRAEREPGRVIPLLWEGTQDSHFLTDVEVLAVDRLGLFSHITAVVADLGLNIRRAEAHLEGPNLARLTLGVEIHERQDLDELIEHLTKLIDVVSARPLTGTGSPVQ